MKASCKTPCESRMREIRTSGLMRGKEVSGHCLCALIPWLPSLLYLSMILPEGRETSARTARGSNILALQVRHQLPASHLSPFLNVSVSAFLHVSIFPFLSFPISLPLETAVILNNQNIVGGKHMARNWDCIGHICSNIY